MHMLSFRYGNLKLVIFLSKQMIPRNFLEIFLWVRYLVSWPFSIFHIKQIVASEISMLALEAPNRGCLFHLSAFITPMKSFIIDLGQELAGLSRNVRRAKRLGFMSWLLQFLTVSLGEPLKQILSLFFYKLYLFHKLLYGSRKVNIL